MKIRFFYLDISKYVKNSSSLNTEVLRTSEVLEAPDSVKQAYRQYILSSLDSDFSENSFGACDELLKEIRKIEDGEIEYFVFDYDGFIHHVNKKSATFEHAIFGVCPHWPLWSCPFSHYKIAVQAARDFYAMPASLDTEVIVELPESDMAKVVLFPAIMIEREESLDLKHD